MWIHRRQLLHWMRSRSLKSPSPRRRKKQGGWSYSNVSGMSLENNGVVAICVMGVPLFFVLVPGGGGK